jgi:hypothetical protein
MAPVLSVRHCAQAKATRKATKRLKDYSDRGSFGTANGGAQRERRRRKTSTVLVRSSRDERDVDWDSSSYQQQPQGQQQDQNYARIAEPVYESRATSFRPYSNYANFKSRGASDPRKRRKFLKAAGVGALAWLGFSALRFVSGVDDVYIYEDENGYLWREDSTGTYNLGPDPDGSKAAEFGRK